MAISNFINLFHAPPLFDFMTSYHNIYITQEVKSSAILVNLMFLRFHLLIRMLSNLSKWTDVTSEDSCEMEGFEADFFFAFKSLLKEKPYAMLFINFFLSIISFGLSVRTFER